MSELKLTPHPKLYHDYSQPPDGVPEQVPSGAAGCQTDLTMEDILERAEQYDKETDMETDSGPGGPDCLEWATQTDERVNFYTGLSSKKLLYGM